MSGCRYIADRSRYRGNLDIVARLSVDGFPIRETGGQEATQERVFPQVAEDSDVPVQVPGDERSQSFQTLLPVFGPADQVKILGADRIPGADEKEFSNPAEWAQRSSLGIQWQEVD